MRANVRDMQIILPPTMPGPWDAYQSFREIWDEATREERDRIATFVQGYISRAGEYLEPKK